MAGIEWPPQELVDHAVIAFQDCIGASLLKPLAIGLPFVA
jgi:hypothetical protein